MPSSGKKAYKGVSSDTNSQNDEVWYQTTNGWICMGCTCLLIVIFIIVQIISRITNWIEETNEEREIIDSRNTTISTHIIDHETGHYYGCTPDEPCIFECPYIKSNLHRNPDDCEYDDWMDIWIIVLKVLGCILGLHLVCCLCGCGMYKKKQGNG